MLNDNFGGFSLRDLKCLRIVRISQHHFDQAHCHCHSAERHSASLYHLAIKNAKF